jgi:hypothetical protein
MDRQSGLDPDLRVIGLLTFGVVEAAIHLLASGRAAVTD